MNTTFGIWAHHIVHVHQQNSFNSACFRYEKFEFSLIISKIIELFIYEAWWVEEGW